MFYVVSAATFASSKRHKYMEKYPFTSAGITSLQAKLYQLQDNDLQAEAILLVNDPRAWLAAHIELTTYQLEFMRGIAEDFILILGWTLAAAVLSRRPFALEDIVGLIGNGICRKANIEIATTITSRYNCDTEGFTTTGSVSIAFS